MEEKGTGDQEDYDSTGWHGGDGTQISCGRLVAVAAAE
jgi:hypothetical protein